MIDFYGGSNGRNGTSSGWRSEPRHRGSYNILSTCLFTVGLCVWTALHLNIPRHKYAKWQWWRKFKWLLIGLFAPEVVAWTAFVQYKAASKLCKNIHQAWAGSLMTKIDGKTQKWTMTHSHYVLMGGLAIVPAEKQTSFIDSSDRFLQGYEDRLTITPEGVKFLVGHDITILQDLSESDIRDKSKANGLAKTLVCLQALWFCVQCVSRLSQGLKISLLELNTFAHALCSLVVYLLWWHKPQDIDEPTLIPATEETLPIIALLCMASQFGRTWKTPQRYSAEVRPNLSGNPAHIPSQGDMTFASVRKPYHPRGKVLVLGQELHGFCITDFSIPEYGDFPTEATDRQASDPKSDPIHLALEPGQVRCIELASQAIKRYKIASWDYGRTDGLLTKYVPNRPKLNPFGGKNRATVLGFLAGFTLAGVLYGGLHLTAWNAPFPTSTQKLWWRLSALTLVASGPALAIQVLGEILKKKYYPTIFSSFWSCFNCLFIGTPWYFTIGVSYLLYAVARVYLVVECFITLNHLPDEVFSVPTWTQYIPHII